MLADRREALRNALNDPEERVRQAAAESLEQIELLGELEQLLRQAVEGARGERVKALFALEKARSERVYPVLLQALEDEDADLRAAAVQVLGRRHHPSTLKAVLKCLKDPEPAVRVHAAMALGAFGDRRLIPYLAAVLKARDDALVCAAIDSLARIGDPDAEEHLLTALQDPRSKVRAAAATALGQLDF